MLKVTVNEKGGGERVLTFDKDVLTIGRSQKNDVILPRSNVSKRHANIEVRDGTIIIADRGSTNGTFINGRKAKTPTAVKSSDKIFISDFIIICQITSGESPEDALTLPPPLPGGSDIPPAPENPERLDAPPTTPMKSVVAPDPEPLEVIEPEEPDDDDDDDDDEIEPLEPEFVPEPVESPSEVEQERKVAAKVYEQVDSVLDLERVEPQSFRNDDFISSATRTIAEVLDAMVDSGQIPQDLEPQSITARLNSEILGMGPLDGWLEDSDVFEIIIPPKGDICLVTGSGIKSVSDPFSCDRSRQLAMRKVLASIRDQTGEASDAITGNLAGGATVSMLLPPLVLEGLAAVIRKPPVQIEGGIDALVGLGLLSDAMAKFFGQCIEARQSVLICDPGLFSHRSLIPAVAGMLEPWERLAALQCGREPLYDLYPMLYGILPESSKDGFDIEGCDGNLVEALSAFRPTALIAGGLGSVDHFRIVHQARSSRGFALATVAAESEIEGLARIGGWIASDHADAPDFVATEIVMDAIDIVVFYSRMIDGSEKVTRISELVRNKDGSPYLKAIFEYEVRSVTEDGRLDGAFKATRHVPSFIEARKGKTKGKQSLIDTSIFK